MAGVFNSKINKPVSPSSSGTLRSGGSVFHSGAGVAVHTGGEIRHGAPASGAREARRPDSRSASLE